MPPPRLKSITAWNGQTPPVTIDLMFPVTFGQ